MNHPSNDAYFLSIARVVATKSTCARRHVGCVVVNKRNHIKATGRNGPPTDVPNCTEINCAGVSFDSGDGLSICEAVHAEVNALLQCNDVYKLRTLYTLTEPCMDCTKIIMNTGIRRIVFIDPYPVNGKALWIKKHSNKTWVQYTGELV